MTTTTIPVHTIRKGDEFVHPVMGDVCTVLSHRVSPVSTLERRVRFSRNGSGAMVLDIGPSVEVVVS